MQTSIDFASQARDKGMKKALDHADRVHDGWSEKAYEWLKAWVSAIQGHFMLEDVRDYAYHNGFTRPPHERAWGSVIRRAATEGLIVKVGYQSVSNVKAHKAFASVWRKR